LDGAFCSQSLPTISREENAELDRLSVRRGPVEEDKSAVGCELLVGWFSFVLLDAAELPVELVLTDLRRLSRLVCFNEVDGLTGL
jgi:hypothetical protein